MPDPMHSANEPLRYQPAYESREEDEAQTTRVLEETLVKIASIVHKDEGHAYRSVHAKSHGLLMAELQIPAGLPPTLAQGLFAKAGNHPVVMRFSTCSTTPSRRRAACPSRSSASKASGPRARKTAPRRIS